MNILVVYCHPSKKSFTFEIFSKLLEGLKKSNHQITISDLYEMDFQSDMNVSEYEREGFAQVD